MLEQITNEIVKNPVVIIYAVVALLAILTFRNIAIWLCGKGH